MVRPHIAAGRFEGQQNEYFGKKIKFIRSTDFKLSSKIKRSVKRKTSDSS